jgi:Lon protease-like protein
VALPHELVRCHIFEERYRTMIARVSTDESESGSSGSGDDGLKSVGCACRVEQVLERHGGRPPEHRRARAPGPFRLVERVEHLAYPAGSSSGSTTSPSSRRGHLERAREAYGGAGRAGHRRAGRPDKLAGMDAYAMAATVDFGLDAKQGLLDLRSENARLRLVSRLFRAAIKRLDFIERAQARARSNGKVRFG